jgi:hypothetical protein
MPSFLAQSLPAHVSKPLNSDRSVTAGRDLSSRMWVNRQRHVPVGEDEGSFPARAGEPLAMKSLELHGNPTPNLSRITHGFHRGRSTATLVHASSAEQPRASTRSDGEVPRRS